MSQINQPHGKGLLIALEGIDGTGKTTQAGRLKEYLQGKELAVVLTKEPTDGYWGKRIRQLPFVGEDMSETQLKERARQELELFINDRQEHVEQVIAPALAQGKVVITDRYYFSTMAYQGAMTLNIEEIRALNEGFAPPPDLVIILLVSPKAALARIKKNRKKGLDPFEREKYLNDVQRIYQNLHEPYVKIVDANETTEEVARNIQARVDELLEQIKD
ncbi:MAG: dTMP kinase [Thermodesulfobacteriota bacterium]